MIYLLMHSSFIGNISECKPEDREEKTTLKTNRKPNYESMTDHFFEMISELIKLKVSKTTIRNIPSYQMMLQYKVVLLINFFRT